MSMPEEKRIVVIEPEGPEDWYEPLKELGQVHFFHPTGTIGSEEVRKIAADAHGAIITSSCGFSAEDMETLPLLRIIAKCGGKPSSVDVGTATKRGIAVTFVPGANSTTVAEYTVMVILDSLRRFAFISTTIGKGLNRNTTDMFGRELRGKTVGLVGYGAIGSEVAKRLAGFDCRVEVYDPFYRPDGKAPDCVTFRDSLDEILPVADALSLHCTLNDSTKGIIGERELGLMKPTAGIINTARAQLIEKGILEDVIMGKRIAFAVLDVFTVEPPEPTHPLLGLDNVILTPHLSSWTPEALYREVRGAVDSVVACFRGETIPGLINPDFEIFHRQR